MTRRFRGRVWDARRAPIRLYPVIQAFHNLPAGIAVLVGESSWRTVSGVIVRTRFGYVWVKFRRFGPPAF